MSNVASFQDFIVRISRLLPYRRTLVHIGSHHGGLCKSLQDATPYNHLMLIDANNNTNDIASSWQSSSFQFCHVLVGIGERHQFFINLQNKALSTKKILSVDIDWSQWKSVDMPVNSVDSILMKLELVDLIVITTQGSEVDVLYSGLNYLNNHRPVVVMTNNINHSAQYYGYSKKYLIDSLAAINYDIFTKDGTKIDLQNIDKLASCEWMFALYPRFSMAKNLFLCHVNR